MRKAYAMVTKNTQQTEPSDYLFYMSQDMTTCKISHIQPHPDKPTEFDARKLQPLQNVRSAAYQHSFRAVPRTVF